MKKNMRLITTLAAALLLLALLWQCVSIYRSGLGFRPEDISLRLGQLMPLAALFAAAALAGSIPERKSAQQETKPFRKGEESAKPAGEKPGLPMLRLGLFLAALVLIGLGIGNGGMRDVFVKAINICTECIGLG